MPPTATGRLALLGVEPKYVQKIVCEPKLATTRAIEFGEYASDRRVPNWTCRCRVGYGVVSLPMWLRPLMIPNYLSHIYNLLNGSQIVHMLPLFLSFSFFLKPTDVTHLPIPITMKASYTPVHKKIFYLSLYE